tara:strand:- start:929 stop:1582 length:654 start_codon:yes stop_codon:yes gene_type:complete
MSFETILKKLEEAKVEAYNNLSSGETESVLQLESSTEEHNCDPAGGEEVEAKRPKTEEVTAPKSLSRATPMDGKTRPKEEIYVTDVTLKATQQKLDALKKVLKEDYNWEGMEEQQDSSMEMNPNQPAPVDVDTLSEPENDDVQVIPPNQPELRISDEQITMPTDPNEQNMVRAKMLILEHKQNPDKFDATSIGMLNHELDQTPINYDNLKQVLSHFR